MYTSDPLVHILPQTPAPNGGLLLFRNGLLQMPGIDFTLTDSTITYVQPLAAGEKHYAQIFY